MKCTRKARFLMIVVPLPLACVFEPSLGSEHRTEMSSGVSSTPCGTSELAVVGPDNALGPLPGLEYGARRATLNLARSSLCPTVEVAEVGGGLTGVVPLGWQVSGTGPVNITRQNEGGLTVRSLASNADLTLSRVVQYRSDSHSPRAYWGNRPLLAKARLRVSAHIGVSYDEDTRGEGTLQMGIRPLSEPRAYSIDNPNHPSIAWTPISLASLSDLATNPAHVVGGWVDSIERQDGDDLFAAIYVRFMGKSAVLIRSIAVDVDDSYCDVVPDDPSDNDPTIGHRNLLVRDYFEPQVLQPGTQVRGTLCRHDVYGDSLEPAYSTPHDDIDTYRVSQTGCFSISVVSYDDGPLPEAIVKLQDLPWAYLRDGESIEGRVQGPLLLALWPYPYGGDKFQYDLLVERCSR